VLLEGLGQMKKSKDLIGNRTRYLPACSIVPQLTTLPRAPKETFYIIQIVDKLEIHQNAFMPYQCSQIFNSSNHFLRMGELNVCGA
jgi:hypothetical protein